MKNLFKWVVILVVAAGFLHLAVATDPAWAQQDRKNLDKAKGLLEKAREVMADVLSPENYKQAKEAYDETMEKVADGKSLDKIRKLIHESIEKSETAIRNTELAKVTFADVIPARQKALDANAPRFATEDWETAKDTFYKAANTLERGKANKAKSLGAEAGDLFAIAELNAIKEDILGDTRRLITTLEKGNAPQMAPITLDKAKQKLSEAETILDKDRYRKEEAKVVNQFANYEARHAGNLAERITNDQENKTSREEIYLKLEAHIMSLGKAAGQRLWFDNGIEKPFNTLEKDLASLLEERTSLLEDRDMLREKYAGKTVAKAVIQEKLSRVEERDARILAARSQFDQGEAQVLIEKQELIIRLTGYTFPSGTATIEPNSYPLLNKLKKAIEAFPGKQVVIEGHTDATGNPANNKTLSQKRADAIKAYLVSNGIRISQVEAVGYGSDKPIARNDTRENRAKNRRVDVVIRDVL